MRSLRRPLSGQFQQSPPQRLAPSSASARGASTVTIRGSSFESGATLTIGGKSTAATFADMNKLFPCPPS
jgi:IPT/TIG domain